MYRGDCVEEIVKNQQLVQTVPVNKGPILNVLFFTSHEVCVDLSRSTACVSDVPKDQGQFGIIDLASFQNDTHDVDVSFHKFCISYGGSLGTLATLRIDLWILGICSIVMRTFGARNQG